MIALVLDASVAMKWVSQEAGSPEALALRGGGAHLFAPELLIPECANALRKKVRRGEFTRGEALAAGMLLSHANIELLPSRHLLLPAAALAIELDHPAYDCLYLAMAIHRAWWLVTADGAFLKRIERLRPELRRHALGLAEAARRV